MAGPTQVVNWRRERKVACRIVWSGFPWNFGDEEFHGNVG
jgi:hypothetical protein